MLVRPKSPGRAGALSLWTTAAGAGLVTLALNGGLRSDESGMGMSGAALLLMGPSFGHFYARNDGQALGGILLRVGSAAAATGGFVLVLNSAFGGSDGGAGAGLFLGGAVVYVVSTVYDVATASRSARRYNDRHGVDFGAGPVIGLKGAGVRLAVRF